MNEQESVGSYDGVHGSSAALDNLISPTDRILITGAGGFIGSRVVQELLIRGFENLVCFTRPSTAGARLERLQKLWLNRAKIEVVKGNLLSQTDCEQACRGVSLILHLAAGTGGKSFPDVYLNSVVTTRNLLEASNRVARLERFVLVSSFTVYTNRQPSSRLDESCPIESDPKLRGSAYCYAKIKQEELVRQYGQALKLPFVIVRPGSVYGEDSSEITGRVGLSTFGLFLHLGGGNRIPFTYVENCAKAIVLAGVVKGVDGEVFNIVDDDLPSSRTFLRMYKKRVKHFRSIYLPRTISYALCYVWEKYSEWSQGQLPPVFNRRRWHAEWRKTEYSNQKLKARLGWIPSVSTAEGLERSLRAVELGKKNA